MMRHFMRDTPLHQMEQMMMTPPPTIKLRFKARQPAASFSISKPKLLEWESKLPDIAHLGPTRP